MAIDYRKIILGAVPSLEDKRDFPISRSNRIAKETLADESDFNFQMTKKNQGLIGSCVGHAVSSTRESKEFEQSRILKVFSAGFIYNNRSETDYQGEGMYPREAYSQLLKCGVVPQSYFPYNLPYHLGKTTLAQQLEVLLKIAFPYRISAYYRMFNNFERQIAMQNLGPFTMTLPIYESFFETGADGIVPPPAGELVGYHEVPAKNWKIKNGNKCWENQNSWGTEWGYHGDLYYNFDYPIAESWATEDYIEPEGGEEEVKMTQEEWDAYMADYLERMASKPADEWSAQERSIVESLGVIQGDANGRKRYKSFVTREEIAAMFGRFIQKLG